MESHLPIPHHIPNPNKHQKYLLNKFGIKLTDTTRSDSYVKYELPLGWNMVDDSKHQHAPMFYVIDSTRHIRVLIYGTWNGNCDNDLRIRVLPKKEIKLYQSSKNKLTY